jgi:hypothetical protein
MSPHGRPEGRTDRSAEHGGFDMSPHGRPKGEWLPLGGKARSAKGANNSVNAAGARGE